MQAWWPADRRTGLVWEIMKECWGYVWNDKAEGFECSLRMSVLCGWLQGGWRKTWSLWWSMIYSQILWHSLQKMGLNVSPLHVDYIGLGESLLNRERWEWWCMSFKIRYSFQLSLGLLALGEVRCPVLKILKQPYGESLVLKTQVSLLTVSKELTSSENSHEREPSCMQIL